MANQTTAQWLLEVLRNRGDARGTGRWPEGDPDYVAEYSLTSEHIPALISLATQLKYNRTVITPTSSTSATRRCGPAHRLVGEFEKFFRRESVSSGTLTAAPLLVTDRAIVLVVAGEARVRRDAAVQTGRIAVVQATSGGGQHAGGQGQHGGWGEPPLTGDGPLRTKCAHRQS